jgi:ADP-ribose pyrophosphatase YjhB (NUDIX family)
MFGEDPADTVVRELTEETGLLGAPKGLAFVHSGSGATEGGGDGWHAIRIVYDVDVSGGELRDEIDESTDAASWFTLDEARQLPTVALASFALDQISDDADAD